MFSEIAKGATMDWNRDWSVSAKNIFEALKIQDGDKLAILFNPEPKGKEHLVSAIIEVAKRSNTQFTSIPLVLDEKFDITSLENSLNDFFKGTTNKQRKCFFTAAHKHFGPSRRAVHKLVSVDPDKLCGFMISLPTDDAKIMLDLSSTSPNYLWKRGEELRNALSKSNRIRITTKIGTDLSFDWDTNRRKYLISAGFPHTHADRWDNMGGEVYTAPLHETVNGKLVIDGAIACVGLVDGNIVVDIKNGRGIINKKESKASSKMIEAFEKELNIFPCASIVGEFGIGTTPNLKLIGELMNDEKVEGTIHIAFGDSYSADASGGENDCDAHTDCMVMSPTVDMITYGKTVRLMDNGKFLI